MAARKRVAAVGAGVADRAPEGSATRPIDSITTNGRAAA